MSDVERLNFYRLSLMILDAGTPTLKWRFKKEYASSGDLETYMRSNNTLIDDLYRRKIINQKQMDLLRPRIKPSLENLDTSLLITLLTNICKIQQPQLGWTVSPAANDMSTGADILRLRDARNKLFHHAKCGISDAEFQAESSNVSATIARLSNQLTQQQQEDIQKTINDVRQADKDSAREKEICHLVFSETIYEMYQMLQRLNGVISGEGRDATIAGLAVSGANQSLTNEEQRNEAEDQPDMDMQVVQGENGIIFVVKLYADLKKELTREMGMSIAQVLFKEENNADAIEEIENASSRRLSIDSLLKRVIHREEINVQSFFMELKSKCPKMTNLLVQTRLTEEDRKKFQLIDDRVQTKLRDNCRVQTGCSIDKSDVQFFQRRLYYSPEVVDQIADVLLSKFQLSFSDHSKVTLCSSGFEKILVLFETCRLDSRSELESVLGSSLYGEWTQFKTENSEPKNLGIWQPVIEGIQGAAASLMESIWQGFYIEFIGAESGSLVLKFLAGHNFSTEVLKPESVKKKLRELLEQTCPEYHLIFKDPVHVTIFIDSPKDADKEEIHFYLETIKDMKEIEDFHCHIGRHERDYMVEEMDPSPLKQWMFETVQVDKRTKILLEDTVSWNDISRGEKMKILMDTMERLEDGYELLERYCKENDTIVYKKVFQPRTDRRTELVYEKGGGLQKLFSTWIEFNEDLKGSGIHCGEDLIHERSDAPSYTGYTLKAFVNYTLKALVNWHGDRLPLIIAIIAILVALYTHLFPTLDAKSFNYFPEFNGKLFERLSRVESGLHDISRIETRLENIEEDFKKSELVAYKNGIVNLGEFENRLTAIKNDLSGQVDEIIEKMQMVLQDDFQKLKAEVFVKFDAIDHLEEEQKELQTNMMILKMKLKEHSQFLEKKYAEVAEQIFQHNETLGKLNVSVEILGNNLKYVTENIREIYIDVLVLKQRTDDIKDNIFDEESLIVVIMINTTLLVLVIIYLVATRDTNRHVNWNVDLEHQQPNDGVNHNPAPYSTAGRILSQVRTHSRLERNLCIIH